MIGVIWCDVQLLVVLFNGGTRVVLDDGVIGVVVDWCSGVGDQLGVGCGEVIGMVCLFVFCLFVRGV